MMEPTDTIDILEVVSLCKHFPIAYFCAEFAVDQKLPIYAGGLGVLAGDLLFQASDESLPYLGIGLLYTQGYVHQEISQKANVISEDQFDFTQAGLRLITKDSVPLCVQVPLHDKQTNVQCYIKMVGTCPLLLLSTNAKGNDAHEVSITDRLYFGDREHRFEQEMVLGIGGYRMLVALGIIPRFYHLNEGHSALLFYELAREKCQKNKEMRLSDAIKGIGNVVFTNHTLIPAGNDVFSKDLAVSYLLPYASEFPVDPSELVTYGLIEDSSLFSPTMLALRLATVPQAVSKLHAKKALDTWSHHPMIPVTNGVRQAFWQAEEITKVDKNDSIALWNAHKDLKKKLITYIETTTQTKWSENDLILGWSRRIARYKRPLSVFDDESKLHSLLEKSVVPVRLVMSGKPHMNDEVGHENLQRILEMVGKFNGSIVYLQNYSLDIARCMLSGIDVLINTPVRGFEACGTSGMKAGLNGVLECTTLDGWTDEVDWKDMGWVLDSELISADFYAKLESEIIPLFVKRDDKGLPSEWISRMRKTIALIEERYTAKRMLKELQDTVYSHIRLENSV